ncbi:MAG: hypothetical protein R2856_08775 [Caldilineaceae bacterium]
MNEVSSPEPVAAVETWRINMDDEIDLREYVAVLIRWWREIFVITAAVSIWQPARCLWLIS